jgi:hypothetical protein
MLEPTDWTEQKMSTNWELWSLVTWSFFSIVLIISRRWNFIIIYLEFVWKSLTLSAIFQHSALLDLDKDTSFFGVFDGHGGKVDWEDHHLFFAHDLLHMVPKWSLTSSYRYHLPASGKVVAKFCSKYLHREVLKSEGYSVGDLGTAVHRAFFRYWKLLGSQLECFFHLLLLIIFFARWY